VLSRRFAGLLMILVGAWGGISPYLGPSIGYRLDTTPAWTWTTANWELNLAPGAAVVLAGLVVLFGGRFSAWWAGVLALAGGSWFVLGPIFASMWLGPAQARVASTSLSQVTGPLGYHYGTGLVIVVLAAWSLGRKLVAAAPVTGGYPTPAAATTAPEPKAGRRRAVRTESTLDPEPVTGVEAVRPADSDIVS
jgi:hypothetical protein